MKVQCISPSTRNQTEFQATTEMLTGENNVYDTITLSVSIKRK
jgi:hypothetical protein